VRSPARIVAVVAAVALVLIAAFAALAIQTSYNSDLRTEASKLSSTAAVTAELVAREMRSVEVVDQTVVERQSFIAAFGSGTHGQIDATGLQGVLDQVKALRPEFQFAAVSDPSGNTIGVSPSSPALLGKNFSYRDWYKGVTRYAKPYVSSAYISAVKGAPLVVAVATPIRALTPADVAAHASPSGGVIGTFFIGYAIGSIQTFADRIANVEHVELERTDQAGVLMARKGGIAGQLTKLTNAPDVEAALLGRTGTNRSATELAAASPIPGIGWAIRATTPVSATAAVAQRRTTTIIASGLLLILAVGAVLLVVGTRRLAHADALHAASGAELQAVLASLTESITVYDGGGALISANPATERMLGFGHSEITDDAVVAERWERIGADGSTLPEDQSPRSTAMRTGLATEGIVMGMRRRSDKAIRWLSFSIVPIRHGQRGVSRYVSSATDVTERVDSTREMRILSEASTSLAASLEPAVVIRTLIQAAARMCSAPGEQQRRAQLFVIDDAQFTVVAEHDVEITATLEGVSLPLGEHPYLQRVVANREAVVAALDYREFGSAIASAMRKTEVRSCAWIPIEHAGEVYAVLAVSGRQHDLISPAQLVRLRTLASIGELALNNARTHQSVAALARTDPLTGLANRRALGDRMRQLPRTTFAILAIDVDDLKGINDNHGHAAGDDAIARIGAALAREVRPSDVVARTGGDEFLGLLVDCDAKGARRLSDRLHQSVAKLDFGWGVATISVGFAVGAPGADPEAVAKTADAALYQAKAEMKRTDTTRDRNQNLRGPLSRV
jgi:diguanylate cyclase (GGDEF)-like protein/PAS domain S-box-containing protein